MVLYGPINLTGRDLHRYHVYRRDVDGLKNVSLQGQLSTIRKFLQFAAAIDAVEPGLYEKIMLPTLDRGEESSDVELEAERAKKVLDFLRTFRYASRQHVMVALAWHTAMRLGSLRSLDVDDFDSEEQCVELRHQPESDTPLKNGLDGERDVALSEDMCGIVEDYIRINRIDVEDDYGRCPLFTSKHGRLTKSNMRWDFYRITRPCLYTECPHDRDPDDCEAVYRYAASKCPSSVSSHPVRRGSITHQLKRDLPNDIVSERVNATREVIEKHYDRRTEREKMEQRRDYIDRLEEDE